MLKKTLLSFALFIFWTAQGAPSSRVKDIASVQSVRDNQLIGYGLVVGLNGTGDSIGSVPFTKESLVAMLERLGVNTRGVSISAKNVAAVMVTANLPPFTKSGVRIDVNLSALGDAKSLQGGVLLVTPLLAADGEVYAIAQGPVAVGGFSAQGQGESITRGVPTSGRIANGAIVEREVPFNINDLDQLTISLKNPDFTTSKRMAEAINKHMQVALARSTSPATVQVIVPENYRGNVVSLLTEIEQLTVVPDQPAKVVISEDSGVIVLGDMVRISKIAIAQGNLTIQVTETPQVSQPGPFSTGGTTTTVQRTNINVEESKGRMHLFEGGASLHELVGALNSLGVGPRDIISILHAVKAAGALQADIEVI